jgi:long-chain acyl-CoA synthetase
MAPRTVYSILDETASRLGAAAALHQPIPKSDGKYTATSWKEYRDAVREIATGLRSLGVQAGGIVAIFSETRAEFYMADLGVMANGSIAAALYTSYPMADQIRNLRVAKPKAIIVENVKAMESLQDAAGTDPLDTIWILITGEATGTLSLAELRDAGRKLLAETPGIFDEIQASYNGSSHAILYLTSGATGEPKMGLVTHSAVIGNLEMAQKVLPFNEKDRTLVFLPSAHIAQRIVLEMIPLQLGMPVWFSESLARLPNELRTVKPTFFLAPPRVWERVYSSICAEIKKRPGVARRLFYAGIGVGSEAAKRKQQGRPIPAWMKSALKVFDRLVYAKIRERLGGAMRMAASGAAPLSKDLAEFYAAIGMPLIEGYGLTEGGVVSLNPLDRPKPGSIGKLLPGVEAVIAEDGELLVKSPCNFSGYYNDPESTAAVLKDGWLYTGDIGEFDTEGYLYITGRKKELIISSNGKKIYPNRIEGMFKSEPLINQMLLIGDKMPYLTALFTINPPSGSEPKPEVVTAEVQKAVARINKQLASFEQIRKFKVLERDFSIEAGELTPTMKVRRNRVLENYRSVVNELYLGKEVE